jgi:hypothetical protein
MKVKNGDFAAALTKPKTADSQTPKVQDIDSQEQPHPAASKRYPVQSYEREIPTPRAFWRTILDAALWLAFLVSVVALAVLHLSPDPPMAPMVMTVPSLKSQVWAVLVVSALALAISSKWKAGRVRTELAYPSHGLAEIPGFCDTDCLDLRLVTQDEEITDQTDDPAEFLPRPDGIEPPQGGLCISPLRDCMVSLGELMFTDRQPHERKPGTPHASQAALLMFASEIEHALGWSAGKVWVLDSLVTEDQDMGAIWCDVLIQGGRSVSTDQLCDAIVKARDAVLTRYACEEL